MNSILAEYYDTFEYYQALRAQLLDLLTDEELDFQIKGAPKLRALCLEIGEIEQAYIQSFKSFKTDFGYRHPAPAVVDSIDSLRQWYTDMDADLKASIATLSQEQVDQQTIDRGDWEVSLQLNLEVYKEALLIFYGKTWVYLKVLGKPLTDQWRHWIGE